MLRFAIALLLVTASVPATAGSLREAQGVAARSAAGRPSKQAPAFDLARLQGSESGRLADHAGRVVLIEFWATYCGWCRSTHPKLKKLAAAQGKDGIVVLGVSAQGKKRLTRYIRRKPLGFTVLHDPRGKVSRAFGARSVPTLIVIDQRGVIRFAHSGANALRAAITTAERLAGAGATLSR